MMDAVNLIENEVVSIYNITNGERLETYVIKGERGSGIISLNGAAARKAAIGDKVIIVSYALMPFEEAKSFKPVIVFPDDNNNLK
jgi:aspartate 1-decarboxylase